MDKKMLRRSIVTGLIVLILEIILFIRHEDKILPYCILLCWLGVMIDDFRYFVKYDALFHPKDWHEAAFPRTVKGQPVLNALAFKVWKWLLLTIICIILVRIRFG